ncbi:RHS repeat-associated core domain-containing protein, partial [Mesorhizobium sp. M7A.F.Ca.US.006.04.2.1]
LYYVLTDQLKRPVMMTDQGRNVVWQASYLPFGEVRSISGTATLNQRFPGQWFQMETGLAYNWHRHYDASIGRYLQPDPLGMPNGPSRWAYVGNSPLMKVDPSGLYWVPGPGGNRWWCWGGNPLDCVLRPPRSQGHNLARCRRNGVRRLRLRRQLGRRMTTLVRNSLPLMRHSANCYPRAWWRAHNQSW